MGQVSQVSLTQPRIETEQLWAGEPGEGRHRPHPIGMLPEAGASPTWYFILEHLEPVSAEKSFWLF